MPFPIIAAIGLALSAAQAAKQSSDQAQAKNKGKMGEAGGSGFNKIDPVALKQMIQGSVNAGQQVPPGGISLPGPEWTPGLTGNPPTVAAMMDSKYQQNVSTGSKTGTKVTPKEGVPPSIELPNKLDPSNYPPPPEETPKEGMSSWDKAAIGASIASGLLNKGGPPLPSGGSGFQQINPTALQFLR